MKSWTREVLETGDISDAMGPDPIGYIAYHADGRMMATVFRRDRMRPNGEDGWTRAEKAELFDTMLAYVARYSLDGGRVVHHVERAWNPSWELDLSRPFTLEDGRLTISGAPGVDPVTGESVIYRMEFERA
ncbi:lipocalin-like domain-containing protein [Roseovarius sp. S4756]|uniref:lipocalin-like domain-containing protein n=1 Tax=Roseovarius maritimus TaxID=3342637 RepID=UPI003726571B